MASIFQKILEGSLPGHFVWKDEVCFAILTIQPIRAGHVMVIPNQEINHWDDVPPATAAYLMQVSQHIAKAIKANVVCKRVGVMVVGLEVPHTHIHLIPADSPADFDFKHSKPAPPDELAAMAAKLRTTLSALGHAAAQLRL